MNFSVRPLPTPPAREVANYSEAERSRLQQQFAPVAAKRRWFGRIAIRGIYALIGCLLASTFGFLGISAVTGSTASWLFPWILVPAGVCIAALLVTILLMPRPQCPACTNRLDLGYGPYCPECGSRALERSDSLLATATTVKCNACRKTMTSGRWGDPYMTRCCTYCGLKLDDEGY